MSAVARRRLRRPGPAPAAVAPAAVATTAPPPEACIGLVTRVFAFGIDLAIVNGVAIVVSGLVSLLYSILSIPDDLRVGAVIAAGTIYLLWCVGYFVTFWSTTGQTPGNRAMRIRVCATTGGRLLPRRSLLRFIGLGLAAIPLFLGYLIILVDPRRRGLHDLIARSLVIDAHEEAGAAGDGD